MEIRQCLGVSCKQLVIWPWLGHYPARSLCGVIPRVRGQRLTGRTWSPPWVANGQSGLRSQRHGRITLDGLVTWLDKSRLELATVQLTTACRLNRHGDPAIPVAAGGHLWER